MDITTRISIRTKKLGVLIRDARESARLSTQECADVLGISTGAYRSYENGRKAPSLPELEILAFFMDLPIKHFWGKEALTNAEAPTAALDLPQLVAVRQRMVGALLRQERINVSISMKALAAEVGIPASRLKAYELGERPIPLPELEALLTILEGRVENFFDTSGPVGQWMDRQRAVQAFLDLPDDLQDFVRQPVNRPYLELARTLSELSADKLRSVAEGLLDITF
ncbi:MAG: helix-turn-helix domain-containing protein [Anaerolineales bacterium]|nr:helix-turn-helix domain-containing protein [Anaerolineales bacterium]